MANIVTALCKFLILLVIVRLGTPDEVGKYNYALVLTAPIFLFFSLKIRSIIVTNEQYKLKEFFSVIVLLNSIVVIIVAIFFIIFSPDNFLIIFIISLIKLFENFKEIPYGIYQKEENLKLMSHSMVIYNVFSLLFFTLIYTISQNLELALSFSLLICILSFLIVDQIIIKHVFDINFKFSLNIKKFKNIIVLSIPLAFSSSLGSLNTGIPRILLEKFYDQYTLGIFSTIAYVLVIGSLFANSISQVFLPKLRKLFKENRKSEFKKLTKKMVTIGMFIGMTSLLFSATLGKELLSVLFGEEYGENYFILIILSFGLLFILSGVFLGTSIIATGKYNVHYKISIMLLISILISGFILIPKYALLGASLTITISQLVALVCYYYFYKKIFRGVYND
ncbi:oligosaccharide flippase family protein [Staphylococcus equorum]|uniref:oligosaccharide flippase family protein n=1 Tax=Staphylococcus equorum TaxID=246432 RepID=UPI002553C4D3|nr:oligosaccharide flippase family protein [Staphylococcus equorum]MDK9855706.1 oligosaccharide flippase family protein [Staphylococcus equorum]